MGGAPSAAAPQAGTGKLPLRVKALFSMGDIVDGTINYGVGTFIFYYLTAVCGISGAIAGTILAVSTIIDAVADPYIGSITDNTRSRLGRRLPYMLVAGFPTAIAFGLLFSIPEAMTGWRLVAYTAVVLLVLRFSTSFYILPYAALSAELSTDYAERSVVFAYRTFLNCVGNIILLVLGYWVFMYGRDGLLDREAYAGFGWTIAGIALTASLISAYGAMPQLPMLRAVSQTASIGFRHFLKNLFEVFQNKSFWCLFLSSLFFWAALGLAATLGIHANLYFWRLPEDVIASLPLVNIAGFVAGIPISAALAKRFEKRNIAMVGLVLASLTLLIPAPLQILGLLPAGEPLYYILGFFAFAGGMAGTCGFVSWGSMMSDAVDEHEMLFGSRREGMYFAGLFLSVKAAAGVGGFFAGIALELIHFPTDLATIGPDGIPHDVLINLALVHGPIAGLLGILGGVVLLAYRIDHKELKRIQASLGIVTPAGEAA